MIESTLFKLSKINPRVSVGWFKDTHTAIRYYEDMTNNLSEYLPNKHGNIREAQDSVDVGKHNLRWTGFRTHDDFITALREGSDEGAALIRALQPVEFSPPSMRRKVVWGEAGDEIDIHRLYKGETDKMWRSTKKHLRDGGSRFIDLIMNASANCGTDSDEMAWNGFLALKLSEALTEAGYFVRLSSIMVTKDIHRNKVGSTAVRGLTLKDYDDSLSLPKLAAVTCFGGYLRMMGFCSIVQAADSVDERVYNTLGRAGSHRDNDVDKIVQDYLGNDKLIFLNPIDCRSEYAQEMNRISPMFT